MDNYDQRITDDVIVVLAFGTGIIVGGLSFSVPINSIFWTTIFAMIKAYEGILEEDNDNLTIVFTVAVIGSCFVAYMTYIFPMNLISRYEFNHKW